MNTPDPAKRIPKSLDTDTDLLGTYTLTDLAVALLPGVIVVLLTQVVLPSTLQIGGVSLQTLTLPIALAGVVLGGLFVYVTPPYASSLEWLTMFIGFHADELRDTEPDPGLETGVHRIHSESGVIEREDGTFVALVQVSPPTMALATDAEWASKTEAFQDFCNTTLEFPIQIFSTTRSFPAAAYLDHYEARLEDPDVASNPQLRTLIEEYTSWYEADLQARQMTIRDHYVVVPVTPYEVQFETESVFSQLTSLPFVGLLISIWFGPSPERQRETMVQTVHERTERTVSGIRGIEGCDAMRVDVEDAAGIIAEFWNGGERDAVADAFRTPSTDMTE